MIFDNVGAVTHITYYCDGGHSVLLLFNIECSFLWQSVWSWLAVPWVAHSSKLSHSATTRGNCAWPYVTLLYIECFDRKSQQLIICNHIQKIV